AVVVASGIHISTADSYRKLDRGELTLEELQNKINSFQSNVLGVSEEGGVNDFEESVFREHPPLRALKQRLIRLGASPAMMSGSGSSVFGIFGAQTQVSRAIKSFRKDTVS